jgi:hypothetical protein
MRASLHPRGLAPLIVNLAQWRDHLIDRLRRQLRITRDPAIDALLRELSGYHVGAMRQVDRQTQSQQDEVAVPLRLRTHAGTLSFLSTVTVFGTPVDITLSELSLEAFYPADDATARVMLASGLRL